MHAGLTQTACCISWSNHKNVQIAPRAPRSTAIMAMQQLDKPRADVMIDESAKSYQA